MYQDKPFMVHTSNTIRNVEQLILELADIRNRGYALDNEEADLGVKCVAVPIHNHSHRTIASMSISGPCERIDVLIRERGVLETLLKASQQISERLELGEEL